jgi:hypothetical protein
VPVAAPHPLGHRAVLAGFLGVTAATATVIGALAILGGGADCRAPGPVPTDQAKNAIPAEALTVYQEAGRRYDIDWAFLASIGAQECDHGRCAGAQQINASGCGGPMQIAMRRRSPCSTGAGPTLWERYRQDGDGDGHAERFDFADAVATAAFILRVAKNAPPIGGSAAGYRQAACGYYGACRDAAVPYADHVMARAAIYGFHEGQATPQHAADRLAVPSEAGCGELADAGVVGAVQIAPGANLPGRPLTRETLAFVARVAGIHGAPLIVTTGTNHDYYTVNGTVSDHASGHAADIGMAANAGTNDGPVGDQIMTACLVAAGTPPAQAEHAARRGGLYTLEHDGLRIQCIWKTDQGGNHHDHVHIGARPTTPDALIRQAAIHQP